MKWPMSLLATDSILRHLIASYSILQLLAIQCLVSNLRVRVKETASHQLSLTGTDLLKSKNRSLPRGMGIEWTLEVSLRLAPRQRFSRRMPRIDAVASGHPVSNFVLEESV